MFHFICRRNSFYTLFSCCFRPILIRYRRHPVCLLRLLFIFSFILLFLRYHLFWRRHWFFFAIFSKLPCICRCQLFFCHMLVLTPCLTKGSIFIQCRNNQPNSLQLKAFLFQIANIFKKLYFLIRIISVSKFISRNLNGQFFFPIPQDMGFYIDHSGRIRYDISRLCHWLPPSISSHLVSLSGVEIAVGCLLIPL